ncbi:glycoside hydrolase family 130 protein [Herbidospora cretacea]|uniref:glycoside hydrolase family 130 protein n=1 Tax=Herbidospora cretacea TaxID=28444 RepID=UPI000773CEE3|nr:glycoside hydrolase family 130 protein [Herbidospora cretacea]
MTGGDLATRLPQTIAPDPRRVIVKLFVPGEDAALTRTRAAALIERIMLLGSEATADLLHRTLERFGARHDDLEATFAHHCDLVGHRIPRDAELPAPTRLLVGAYFSHEYAVEAAALCNPSMVPHPDQAGLDPGCLRVAVSLRQIGEGHLSSIGFLTAVVTPGPAMVLDDRCGPPSVGHRHPTRHRRDLLAAGLSDDAWDNEASAAMLESLPDRFTDDDFEQAVARLPADLLTRTTTQRTLDELRRATRADYAVTFPVGLPLHRRVLWPAIEAESNGMEDARFVKIREEDGRDSYRATYTAYDGRHIRSHQIASDDLRHFEITPMRGPASVNKGMALFPRQVAGRTLALCRSDGETIGLTTLDAHHMWQAPVPLHTPRHSWELIQVGNCGSPIETEHGWLVLTHGVGPMRDYAIGALLLDLDEPDRVIAELPGPLLSSRGPERDGYVPNVVYSCGGLLHEGVVWIPYGASDTRIGFATVPLATLIEAMRPDVL